MEKLLAHIKSLTHDGRGVASIAGKTTFIEGALAGETVAYQVIHRHKRYDEARVVEVIEAAPHRVQPRCKHFTICGGCSLQHVDAQTQIQAKQQTLLEQLTHFGGVEPRIVLPPLLGPLWGYRRKARLGVKFVNKKEKVIVGFREKNSRYLADLQQCEVLHPSVGYQLEQLSAMIRSLSIYQHIAQLEVAIGETTNADKTNNEIEKVEVAYVIRHLQPLPDNDIATLIEFGKKYHARLYLQPGGPETVSLLWPSNHSPLMKYTLPDHQIEILFSPMDFTQINLEINRKLVNLALELIEPDKNDQLLDLFCGLGNFTLPLAKYVNEVTGVEGNSLMIERAKLNAKHNDINNATFFVDDLTKSSVTTLCSGWHKKQYNKILLDPARSGALEIIQQFPHLKANRIVYVSCNPATLARDAGELVKNQGYTLTQAGVIDMFPHTSHVESIALFEK